MNFLVLMNALMWEKGDALIIHTIKFVETMIQIPVWNGLLQKYVPDQQIAVMETVPQIKDQTGIVRAEFAPTIVYMILVANSPLIIFLVIIMMFGGLIL